MASKFPAGPIWHSRGYLPHHDWPGATQFITFRLADSLPAEAFHEWRFDEHGDPTWARVEVSREIEALLDAGAGACHLADPRIASLVESELLHFDGDRYRIVAWVIMPNHVHVVVRLLGAIRLRQVVHGWKWHSAKVANQMLGRTGRFWQPEYFDRRVRDDDDLRQTIEYVELNPVNAGLCVSPADWRFGSARYRSAGGAER